MPANIARVAFVQTEYRSTPPLEDLAVKTRDPLATELVYGTLIEKGADAQAFQQEILDLRRADRFDWQLQIVKDRYTFGIGDTISVFYPRFGFDNGANFIVKRIRRDQTSNYDTVMLYGPQ